MDLARIAYGESVGNGQILAVENSILKLQSLLQERQSVSKVVGLSIQTGKVVVRDSSHSVVLLGKHLGFLEQLAAKLEVALL